MLRWEYTPIIMSPESPKPPSGASPRRDSNAQALLLAAEIRDLEERLQELRDRLLKVVSDNPDRKV